MPAAFTRIANTPPVKDAAGVVITPGKLDIWDVDEAGVERKWSRKLTDNIADCRVVMRPDGGARLRILIEIGDAVADMKGPNVD